MRRVAVAGLVWFVAAAAHAQVQGPPNNPPAKRAAPSSGVGTLALPTPTPAPEPAAPALAAAPCMLVAKDSGAQTPLPAFDTAITSVPLPMVPTSANAAMVLCYRTTIVPEVSDYRVLAEMHLPLAIRAGQRTLFLGSAGDHFQVGVQDGDVTPQEKTALQDRMDQMQSALEKASAKK